MQRDSVEHASMHTHSHMHAQTHVPHSMFSLIVTVQSLALGYIHPLSFVIDLLVIDAIFINSVAKQHVSHTSENLVAICLASSAHVCLFGGSDTIQTLFCCVKSLGRNSHTHQWSRCVLVFRLLLRLCFYQRQQRQGHAPLQYKNSMMPHPS